MTDKKNIRLARRVIWIGFAVNVALSAVKLAAGFLASSSALIADGIHSLSDLVTDVVALVGIRMGSRPEDDDHAYGHGKFETLATGLIGLMLLLAAAGIAYAGLQHVAEYVRGEMLARPGLAALMVAVLSIAAKEVLYRYTIGRGRAINSSAVIANAWHHRSDAFSSIGTVIGIAGAMFLGESWRILDPLAAIAISLFIVRAGVGIMRDSFDELLEKSLDKEMEHKILEAINEVSGALKPHRLRTRKVGRVIAMDVHVKVDAALNIVAAHEIATRVESRIRELLGAETIISVHIEPDD